MAETELVARTRRLDHDVDLLAFAGSDGLLFERDGSGVAARGELLRIEVPPLDPAAAAAAVAEGFAAIAVDDEVGLAGCGPVAFGAFPFDPAEPRSLVVPSTVVGRADDGTRWITTIGPVDAQPQAWTPDGAAVLARVFGALVLIPTDGSAQRTLVSRSGFDADLEWLPDADGARVDRPARSAPPADS